MMSSLPHQPHDQTNRIRLAASKGNLYLKGRDQGLIYEEYGKWCEYDYNSLKLPNASTISLSLSPPLPDLSVSIAYM